VEIFNAWIAAHPAPDLEPLPTYRILPRDPVSQHVGGPPYPVHDAYGYLEFLSHSFTGQGWGAFSYYPVGGSDYLIFQLTRAAPVIRKFYRQAGQFLALAATFSMIDLHVENVRATQYQPRLIDLEASLTAPIAGVRSTALLDTLMGNPVGGYNGSMRDDEDYVYRFTNAVGRVDLDRVFVDKWYDNRLWALRPDRRLVPVNAFWLLQGITNGMNTLRAIQNAGGFAAWLLRAANVLVRVLPVPTSTWNETLREVYALSLDNNAAPNPPVLLAPTVVAAQTAAVTGLFQQGNAPEPKYVAAAAGQAATDLTNFDVPTFYHRVGTTDLLDSAGLVIPVPAQVTIFVAQQPVQVNTLVGRNTYFAAAPTAARVGAQLAALTGGGFGALVGNYRTQSLQVLNIAIPPQGPGVLI
jgi:hypothetical protein